MARKDSSQPTRDARQQTFRLGELIVDPQGCLIDGPFGKRHLEPRVMALLVHLAERPKEVVLRNELLDTIWAGTVVSDQVLTRAISELRRMIDNKAVTPPYIQTVSKRGYCLNYAPQKIRSEDHLAGLADQRLEIESEPRASLAVIPLENLSGERSGELLSLGFTRDLNHLLCLVPGLRLVAFSSVQHCHNQLQDPIEIARKLSSRYVVCGAIEHRGSNFRLHLELIDTAADEQLWSGRFDEQVSEFFAVQDQLVQQIARSLSTAVVVGNANQIQSRATFNLNAYELIQISEDARRNYNRTAAEFIVANLNAALKIQPENGVAHALLAMQHSQNLVSRWCDDPAETSRLAAKHLDEALHLAPADSRVLMASGISDLMQGRHRSSMHKLRRSLELNPNEPHVLAEYAMASFYVNRELEPSIALLKQAELAAPRHPRFSIWAYRRGICYYEAGLFDQAIEAYDECIARSPTYHHTYLTQALAFVEMKDDSAAKNAIERGRRYAQDLSCDAYLAGIDSFGLTTHKSQVATFRTLWAATALN